MTETDGLRRRDFLQPAPLRGAVAALWAIPQRSGGLRAAPIPSRAGRSVEGGLTLFAQRWQAWGRPSGHAVRPVPHRQGLQLPGGRPAALIRPADLQRRGAAHARHRPVPPRRHDPARGRLERPALRRFHGPRPVHERQHLPGRDAANKVALLGILMHTSAHFPAGSNPPDPELLVRVARRPGRRGAARLRGRGRDHRGDHPLPRATPSRRCATRPCRRPARRRSRAGSRSSCRAALRGSPARHRQDRQGAGAQHHRRDVRRLADGAGPQVRPRRPPLPRPPRGDGDREAGCSAPRRATRRCSTRSTPRSSSGRTGRSSPTPARAIVPDRAGGRRARPGLRARPDRRHRGGATRCSPAAARC